MDFTEVFPGSTTRFSNDGQQLAHIVGKQKIVVRNVDTLQILHLLDAKCQVDALDWSADSQLILGVCTKQESIKVWKLTAGNDVDAESEHSDEYWTAQINLGVDGCALAKFSPIGHNVMVWDEYGVCTFTSLTNA